VEQSSLLEVGTRLLAIAGRFPPFNIAIRGAGGFPNARRPSVLWFGVEPDAPSLFGVVAELEGAWKELGRSVEARPYHPHLTLARSRARGGDARLAPVIEALGGVDLGSCAVRELVLYRSDSSPAGVRYTTVLRAPLLERKQEEPC
jgi:2'-5' RNA ligase